MPDIDLYQIAVELLGDEQADATIVRLGTLQGVIDRVNAALATRSGPVPAANKEAGTLRRPLPARPLSGTADRQAAGTVPSQPARAPAIGLTPAAVLRVIQAAHAPNRRPRALAPTVSNELLERGGTQAGRIAVPEGGRLIAKAGPSGMQDSRGLQALSRKLGGADEFLTGDLARKIALPRDPFPWHAVGVEPGAKAHEPLQQTAAGARDAGGLVRIGTLTGRTDRAPMPTRLLHKTSKVDEAGAHAGTVIERTWRRLQRSGGTEIAAGDAAYLSAAGMGTGGFGASGAIATATKAAAVPWAARGRPAGDPSLADGMTMPGATPDRPLYARIIIDQPLPTMVTNHDVLTSATVSAIAQHQSAMPTAPTGMNNNLVPPAPGVPAPGSYLP
jgi:hypothetical protein